MKKCDRLLRRRASSASSLLLNTNNNVRPSGTHSAPIVRARAPCGPGVTQPVHLGPGIRLLDYVFVPLTRGHRASLPPRRTEERGEIIPCFNQLNSWALRLNTEACKFNNAEPLKEIMNINRAPVESVYTMPPSLLMTDGRQDCRRRFCRTCGSFRRDVQSDFIAYVQ